MKSMKGVKNNMNITERFTRSNIQSDDVLNKIIYVSFRNTY
jgi:hypothetical protein